MKEKKELKRRAFRRLRKTRWGPCRREVTR